MRFLQLCSRQLFSSSSSSLVRSSSVAAFRPLSRTISSSPNAFSKSAANNSAPTKSVAKTTSLKHRVQELVPQMRSDFADLKKAHGNTDLGSYTVGQAIGGMRGMIGLYTETSLLDAEEGIRFRGYSIPEIQKLLPKASDSLDAQPLPEGLLWLLLTGEIPDARQVYELGEELKSRSHLPGHIVPILNSFPTDMHPMTQLCAAVCLLQTESKFAAAYQRGVNKQFYWEYALEDSLDLIARLPQIAAIIYRNAFHEKKHIAPNKKLDYAADFAHQLGFANADFHELMRLYLTIHSDHEGGNVSAHTCHLVGSALSDPYLSFNAAMAGLAGPLHGLANQEVLRWLLEFKKTLPEGGKNWSREDLIDACWRTLNEGRVIPGYGHAVLRKTDPRYSCQRQFALKHLPNDPMFRLVSDLYSVVPDVLTKHGKTQNPWPNVDAHSGVLLQYYGLKEAEYYTVLFGVSRALGVLSQLVIDRILGLPIERPKSVDSKWIRTKAATAAKEKGAE